MKPIVAVLGLFVAVGAGALGGYVGSSMNTPAEVELAATRGAVHGTEPVSRATDAEPVELHGSGVADEVRRLSDELARVQAELANLREGRARESAMPAPTEEAADVPEAGALAIVHRDAILRVIDEDRKMQAQKAEDERKAREAEQAMQRAERLGKELGMNQAQTRALGDFYVLETERRNEMFKDFRNGNMPTDREQARTMFQEYRDWRTGELNTRLGNDLAAKVTEADGGMDRRGFGGMFGGEGGQNAGGNGQGGERGARRARTAPATGGAAGPGGPAGVAPGSGG